jgi:hypothetical protein
MHSQSGRSLEKSTLLPKPVFLTSLNHKSSDKNLPLGDLPDAIKTVLFLQWLGRISYCGNISEINKMVNEYSFAHIAAGLGNTKIIHYSSMSYRTKRRIVGK